MSINVMYVYAAISFSCTPVSLKKSTVGMSVISMTCHPVSVFLHKGQIETSIQVFKKDSAAV